MRVTILQKDIYWADIEANLSVTNRMIKESRGSDLYLLPEMWSTGFAAEPEGIAEGVTPEDNITLKWMINAANDNNCVIAGSVAVKDGEKYKNRFYFIRPDGSYEQYDKHHLFRYGHEDKYYEAGNRRVIAEYKNIRFLLNTCYDLRFPIWQRNFNDYDVLLMTANWPQSRQNAWETLLKARAIENQCYAIGCNRVGNDPHNNYAGGSAIIDAYGHTLCESMKEENDTISAELNMEALRHLRTKFPVLDDTDQIIFKNINN